jgi:hypothetical protein
MLILRKGMYPQISSADALDRLTYNILMTTWKKMSETGLQTFQPEDSVHTRTFIVKFITCCTILSTHPTDASDIILDQRLSGLKVEPCTFVPYDFSCGVSALDEQNGMIIPVRIRQEGSDWNLWLCTTHHPSIILAKRLAEFLANFRRYLRLTRLSFLDPSTQRNYARPIPISYLQS